MARGRDADRFGRLGCLGVMISVQDVTGIVSDETDGIATKTWSPEVKIRKRIIRPEPVGIFIAKASSAFSTPLWKIVWKLRISNL
jgi:hypothetical protein